MAGVHPSKRNSKNIPRNKKISRGFDKFAKKKAEKRFNKIKLKKLKSKRVARDIRSFYRRAYHEVKNQITDLEKMSSKQFLSYLKENGLCFDKSENDIKEISKHEGLINYTIVFLANEKLLKVVQSDSNNELSKLLVLKKDLLNNESPSIYSDRSLTTVTESMLDDGKITKYEKERIKNVKIKCRRLFNKATKQTIEKKDFIKHCEENNIEVPIKSYDKSIYAFMVRKFDRENNFFLIDRSHEKCEELRLLDRKNEEVKKDSIPTHTYVNNIEWNIDGIIGYRKKNEKIQGLCAWCPVNGKNFEPSWEDLENIKPENEQSWEQKKIKNRVHIENMFSINDVLKNF